MQSIACLDAQDPPRIIGTLDLKILGSWDRKILKWSDPGA